MHFVKINLVLKALIITCMCTVYTQPLIFGWLYINTYLAFLQCRDFIYCQLGTCNFPPHSPCNTPTSTGTPDSEGLSKQLRSSRSKHKVLVS